MALENTHFRVAEEYVVVNVIVLYCAFFNSLQPIACIAGTVGLFLLYWVKKYLLFNRYTRPEHFGKEINSAMITLLDFAPFFFAFGSLMTINLFNKYDAVLFVPNLVAIGISCINIFVPFDRIYECCASNDEANEQKAIYEESRLGLFDDYDRSNPVTRDQALALYFEQLSSASTSEEEKKFYKDISQNMPPPGINPMTAGFNPFSGNPFGGGAPMPGQRTPMGGMPMQPMMRPGMPMMRPGMPMMRPGMPMRYGMPMMHPGMPMRPGMPMMHPGMPMQPQYRPQPRPQVRPEQN